MIEQHEHKFDKYIPVIVGNDKPTEQMSRCQCGAISIKPLSESPNASDES